MSTCCGTVFFFCMTCGPRWLQSSCWAHCEQQVMSGPRSAVLSDGVRHAVIFTFTFLESMHSTITPFGQAFSLHISMFRGAPPFRPHTHLRVHTTSCMMNYQPTIAIKAAPLSRWQWCWPSMAYAGPERMLQALNKVPCSACSVHALDHTMTLYTLCIRPHRGLRKHS